MKPFLFAVLAFALGASLAGCARQGQYTASTASTGQVVPPKTEISLPVEKPTIISAEEWGSSPDVMPPSKLHEPSRLTVHHAGEIWRPGRGSVARLTALQTWGKRERNWPDLPYHFLIAPDGRIYEGRDIRYEPETNTNYDTSGHIGVQLWGNFEEQRVSEEQLDSAVRLLAWLSEQYAIEPLTIVGHKDVAATLCPGRDLYRYISEGHIARWVTELREGRPAQIRLLPPADGGPTEMIKP